VSSLAATIPGLVRHHTQHRDVAAFLTYTDTYIGGYYDSSAPEASIQDRRWAAANSRVVLAEGERACAWLAAAPEARAAADNRFQAVLSRYLETPQPEDVRLSATGRSVVTVGAWEYLCRRDRERHTSPDPAADD